METAHHEQVKDEWKGVMVSVLLLVQFSQSSSPSPHSLSVGTPGSLQPGILEEVLTGTVMFSKGK